MGEMFRIDLANRGFGGEINSATRWALEEIKIPDLCVAIRATEEGLGKGDCAKLEIGYDDNKKPEFATIKNGIE
jgi:hypothetical protein